MIRHHLDQATLISYAAGSLSQSMALVVACHLSVCSHCRQQVQQSEAIGGLLLSDIDSADIGEDALANVLDCLDEKDFTPVFRKQAEPESSTTREVPRPLRDYIGASLDDVAWKRIVPGVFCFDLPLNTAKGGVSRLLRIAPGKAMLAHTHEGNELTLVLRGSYADEVGRFTAGDVADLDGEIEHQPLVDSEQECICLIATDAPLKFSSLLGRLVQPITGF